MILLPVDVRRVQTAAHEIMYLCIGIGMPDTWTSHNGQTFTNFLKITRENALELVLDY